jgi:hypothetical protein
VSSSAWEAARVIGAGGSGGFDRQAALATRQKLAATRASAR